MSLAYFPGAAVPDHALSESVSQCAQTLKALRPAKNVAQAGHVIPFDSQERRLVSLVRCAQAGDRAAGEEMLRVSMPFIKMVARRQGVPMDAVDDVVQETLLTIHRSLMEYDPNRPFSAWLRIIAKRRAIDFMRGQGRTGSHEVHEPLAFENHSDPMANPEEEAEQTGRRRLLSAVAASLPKRQREAVEQLALAGRSLLEAAAATGQTQGALTVNLHRALKALQARFSQEKTTAESFA